MPSQRQREQRLSSHRALALRLTEPAGFQGQAATPTSRIRPPRLAGNAVRNLAAHGDQRRIRLVSPNQLLKHYTDDDGCGAYTGSEPIKYPIARRAAVAAREQSKIALRGTKGTCFLPSCCLGAPAEPPPRFLRAIWTGRRAWVCLLIPQHHCLWEQRLADKRGWETCGFCWLSQLGSLCNDETSAEPGRRTKPKRPKWAM